MRKGKIALSILCLVVGFLSCNNDDDGVNSITEAPLVDRADQQVIDKDSIVKYLNGHYYNASAFVSNPNPSIRDLIISELPSSGVVPDPDNNKLLMDDVALKTVKFADTDYEFYILDLNPSASGQSPKFSDLIRVNYEGFELNNDIFDSAVTPVDFDLVSVVPGWRKAIPFFNAAESFTIVNDGTVSYTNHGVGIMFLPSGLAYFNSPPSGSEIQRYAPIAFKFDLLQTSIADHDNDGVPSYLEDIDKDGELFDENTDGDFDNTTFIPILNYLDPDDDGDGILTRDEIVIKTYNEATKAAVEALELAPNEELVRILKEADGTFTGTTITFTDTDTSDDVPDYLDKNN